MKSRIGANIFNEEDISSSDSLDGLTQQYMRWFSQLAADIWNEGSSVGTLPTHFTYSTTGAQTKTDSIMDLINDLETAVAPIPALQAAVAALSGVTADLTYIETIIGNITGMPAHGSDWDDTPNYPGWGNFTLYDAAGRIQTHIDDTGNVHDLLWDDATLVNGAGDTIQDELDLIYGPAGYLIAIKNILWPTDPNIANLSSLITNFTGTTYLGIYTNYHDAIVELDTVIDDIQDQIDAINAIVGPLVTEVDDHEIRIDVLEADALKIRMYSLAPQEVVDGFRVSFTWAERVLYEELPLLGGGYDWPYGSTIDVELEYTPVHAPGNYFTESLIFVTDVYDLGRLPLYPGEYVVIDQVHFNTYAVGEVGHLYVIPDFTVHVPGYISYYTPGLYDLQYYTIEVFVNGVLQAPFRDWGPGSSPDVNSIIFDTAPIVGSTIAFHGTKS